MSIEVANQVEGWRLPRGRVLTRYEVKTLEAATHWIESFQLPPRQKAVAMAIARGILDSGEVWIDQDIARETDLDVKAVERALVALERRGVVHIAHYTTSWLSLDQDQIDEWSKQHKPGRTRR
jgi:hypothetical protein